MSHFTVREWGHLKLGEAGFTRAQADALHAAACQHPLAHRDGTNMLIYRRDRIVARQMVGMVAAKGCSLEILPKVDPDAGDSEAPDAVRNRLVRMLNMALGLDLDMGREAAIERQSHTLLEVLIRAFSEKLMAEVRRGLPRRYHQCEDVRPDRLACRFDQLDPDTPLMRVMASAVVFLGKHVRSPATRRKLDELRHALAEIPLVPVARLPWKAVQIDRTNRRWESLFRLAQLLLRRDWQATHLLFPMNDLFEKYIAALMRKALAGSGIEVVDQGGHRACLGAFTGGHLESGDVFRTKPDIILRKRGRLLAIIDTKWKKLATNALDRKHGVSQADVYQLMAYARLYPTRELMLLYPSIPGEPCGEREPFGVAGGSERLAIATIDTSQAEDEVTRRIAKLCERFVSVPQLSVS